jgi:hypothetical protein
VIIIEHYFAFRFKESFRRHILVLLAHIRLVDHSRESGIFSDTAGFVALESLCIKSVIGEILTCCLSHETFQMI